MGSEMCIRDSLSMICLFSAYNFDKYLPSLFLLSELLFFFSLWKMLNVVNEETTALLRFNYATVHRHVCNMAKEKTEGQVKCGSTVDEILLGSIIPLNIYKY